MNPKDLIGILPQYDDIMEHQRDEQAVKAEIRQREVDSIAKEYFNDPGTFFEFIQNIEIGVNDETFFDMWHRAVKSRLHDASGFTLEIAFEEYCQDKAEEEV